MKISLEKRVLIGRLLTRSGDQAWDFAVPIVLLKVLPGHLRIAALFYLLVRCATVLLLPRVARMIDTTDRKTAVKLGLGIQFLGVLGSSLGIFLIWKLAFQNPDFGDIKFLSLFSFLVIGGIVSTLGASLIDIAIANDLAPSIFEGAKLTRFNGHFRQVDLATEVASPIIAGLLLSFSTTSFALFGFALIALWNLFSFLPEYLILLSVFNDRPDLQHKPVVLSKAVSQSLFDKLTAGWRAFFREPVALAMVANALLWFSVLSPHGVLLTGFLQDGWKLPEWMIGAFRGSGAVFGLAATLLFPRLVKAKGLAKASHIFLLFQTAMVLSACSFFFVDNLFGQACFLILILFSRIGVYGFTLGEMQIRQEGIDASNRGQVNGFANALTGIATLLLFSFGTLLADTQDFQYLILLSTTSVFFALIVFSVWRKRSGFH